jgi:anti-sigma-K factor RskA
VSSNECVYREEDFVDYLLEKIDTEKCNAIKEHILECEDCYAKVKEWNILLINDPATQPSKAFKKRLKAEVIGRKNKRKFYFPGIVFASCIVILMASIMLSPLNNQVNETAYVHQHFNQTAQDIIANPDAQKFHIKQVKNQQNIIGNVWVDNHANEMFMEVEGITPINERDYQIWLVHSNNTLDSEILRIQNGKVYLYYKGPQGKNIKLIKVSIEPVGGSKYPTGPDALNIRFD